MKTAISVPDETFQRATRQAAALGMSRSEFFTRSVQHYLSEIESDSVTREIDEVVGRVEDDSAADAVRAGRTVLEREPDSW